MKQTKLLTVPTPKQVKEMRLRAKLTQQQAAEAVFTTNRSWHNWESGKAAMPVGLWELIQLKIGARQLTLLASVPVEQPPIDPRVQANLDEWMQTEEDKMIDREMAIWQIRKQKESEREEWMKMEERVRQEEEEQARIREAKEALKRGTVFDDRDIEEVEHE